jgi:hypothetical protein
MSAKAGSRASACRISEASEVISVRRPMNTGLTTLTLMVKTVPQIRPELLHEANGVFGSHSLTSMRNAARASGTWEVASSWAVVA